MEDMIKTARKFILIATLPLLTLVNTLAFLIITLPSFEYLSLQSFILSILISLLLHAAVLLVQAKYLVKDILMEGLSDFWVSFFFVLRTNVIVSLIATPVFLYLIFVQEPPNLEMGLISASSFVIAVVLFVVKTVFFFILSFILSVLTVGLITVKLIKKRILL